MDEKIKILNEIFHDQASELRMMKAERYVEEKKAKNFKDACEMIKREENNAPKKYTSIQEMELRKNFSGRS